MPRNATRRSPRWQTRVRWRDEDGGLCEQELQVDRLPEPFGPFSHPEVAGGRPMHVDGLSPRRGRAADLALSPARRRASPAAG